MAFTVTRLRWQASRALERAGPAGVAAGALAFLFLAAWYGWAWPTDRNLKRLHAENEGLQRRLDSRPSHLRVATDSMGVEQQLAAFDRRFPNDKGITPVIARLHSVAVRHGLQLQQAEFRLSGQGDDALSRYSMVLPVKGDYRSLRAFIDDVLHDIPSVALEELSLRRDDTKLSVLDARLRFVLFVARSGT